MSRIISSSEADVSYITNCCNKHHVLSMQSDKGGTIVELNSGGYYQKEQGG
jgi:hypothetical protein